MKTYVRLLVLLAAISGCGPFQGGDDFDPERFATVVERARDDGLRPYWLGREFAASGVVWDEIDPSEYVGDDDTIDWVGLHYFAEDHGGINVVTISSEARQPRNPNLLAQVDSYSEREVTLLGKPGQLFTTCLGTRCPNTFEATIDLGDQAVIVTTNSQRGNGREVNPLMEESLFLAVLEDLRPYPD